VVVEELVGMKLVKSVEEVAAIVINNADDWFDVYLFDKPVSVNIWTDPEGMLDGDRPINDDYDYFEDDFLEKLLPEKPVTINMWNGPKIIPKRNLPIDDYDYFEDDFLEKLLPEKPVTINMWNGPKIIPDDIWAINDSCTCFEVNGKVISTSEPVNGVIVENKDDIEKILCWDDRETCKADYNNEAFDIDPFFESALKNGYKFAESQGFPDLRKLLKALVNKGKVIYIAQP